MTRRRNIVLLIILIVFIITIWIVYSTTTETAPIALGQLSTSDGEETKEDEKDKGSGIPISVAKTQQFVRFNSNMVCQHLENTNLKLNIRTNKGFTSIARIRFVDSPGRYERLFEFCNGPSQQMTLVSRLADTDKLLFVLREQPNMNNMRIETAIGSIVQNEWMDLVCTYDGTTGSGNVLKNGSIIGFENDIDNNSITDRLTTQNYIARSSFGRQDAYANIDIQGLLVYDRLLTSDEIQQGLNAVKNVSSMTDIPQNPKVKLLASELETVERVGQWDTFVQVKEQNRPSLIVNGPLLNITANQPTPSSSTKIEQVLRNTDVALSTLNPTGTVLLWSTNVAPNGWLLCNGEKYPKKDFTPLWSVIGYTYGGSGDMFAVPDMRERLPLGESNKYKLNGTGGEKTVTLNITQIPSHTHTVDQGGNHQHSYANWKNQGGGSNIGNGREWGRREKLPSKDVPHSHTCSETGGNQPHENRPPYIALHYIIKI